MNKVNRILSTPVLFAVKLLIGILNKLQLDSRRYDLNQRSLTAAELDQMSPRQLKRLEAEGEEFLRLMREHQIC